MVFTAVCMAREAQIRNPLMIYNIWAWPGRLKFVIRSLFITLGVARKAQIRNPFAIYNIWRGQYQLKDANHDG